MIITLVQMNSVIGDFRGNAKRMVELAKKAREGTTRGADAGCRVPTLVVFPELSLCGYPPMDLLDQNAFVAGNLAALRYLQKELPPELSVAVGYVDRNRTGSGRALVNAMSVIAGGKLVFTQDKTLLPTYDVFDEARYFEPARTRKVFTPPEARIGFAICEDFWWEAPPEPSFKYPVDPVKDLLDAGIDILIVPSASPFVAGKLQTRLSLARSTALEGQIPVLYCNAVGANDSLVFDGRSFAVNCHGEAVATCGWGESFLTIDTETMESDILDLAESEPAPDARARAPGCISKEEEIHQALIVGIRDYMRKSGFSKACLGLSGGIDSAIVAVLAAEAIGPENISCIAMPSRFSSDGSLDDAVDLCRRNHIMLERLSIEGPFTSYLNLLEKPFAGKAYDSTEENLQARIRGTLLMAWSNKFNALLLTTGNKSELAAGYCTLYGDMCGALAPIGDLFKTEVYALAKHLNKLAEAEGRMAPIPQPIIDKAPSAELRFNQTDQDTLPPYDLLDAVLREYIEENRCLEEIVALGYDRIVVEKILSMTARAEYKRRQAAPAIKVSKRAFGIGRRLPLARAIHEITADKS
ncbi:MAG: NAD+ synthase [Spirochaetaceae bacterium]|nr:NAD+ synthase [Spirochaetaceae bacterium]